MAFGMKPNSKMPGYTGHLTGVNDIIGKTPAHAQICTELPAEAHTHTRDYVKSRWNEKPDPCNNTYITLGPTIDKQESLWPDTATQTTDVGKTRKAALVSSTFVLGDKRYEEPFSHYSRVHSRPGSARQTGVNNGVSSELPVRVPTGTTTTGKLSPDVLKRKYLRAKERVEKSATPIKMLKQNLRQRFEAKINPTTNRNGFTFRQMFNIFDVDNDKELDFEEFWKGLQLFGLQFDAEQCLAIFAEYDDDFSGRISYIEFMQGTLDEMYQKLAFSGCHVDKVQKYTR